MDRLTAWRDKKAAHEGYGKISRPAWESRYQHTDEHAGSNSAPT
jgi:hypothetical protein